MTDFWQRLRQRKLVQWAVAYIAAAFALLQGVDIVAQRFEWPDSIARVLIIVSCIGFFVVLLLAWYHGERGAQKVSGTELVLLALLLAIGGGLAWKFARQVPAMPAASVSPPAMASKAANTDVNADRKSIAVLPFVNMSGDKDNQYFSDGISEEILNVLAKTPDLHVAARTSSFSFQDKQLEIPEIARALDVRMVLEGSVRKQRDRVRITAQLIDARTGFHVWSETYDRELKDIFVIQDEIAKSIGDALEVKLADAPQAGKNSIGTTDLEAYELYLRGIALWQTRDADKILQAIGLFDQAIAADPGFAQAYGGQALAYATIPGYSNRIPEAEATARASAFGQRALVRDPLLPEAYAALGYVAVSSKEPMLGEELLRRAIALRPSFATAYQWLALTLVSRGDLEAALAAAEKAASFDPRSLIVAQVPAAVLRSLGRADEAKARCEKVLETAPDQPACLEIVAFVDLERGDYAAARPAFDRFAAAWNPSASAQGRELVDALTGHGDKHALAVRYSGLAVASSMDHASGNALIPWDIPVVLVLLGERGLALGYMERFAVESSDSAQRAVMLPALDPIRCDPRFVAVVKQLQTHDPHYARVCAGKP